MDPAFYKLQLKLEQVETGRKRDKKKIKELTFEHNKAVQRDLESLGKMKTLEAESHLFKRTLAKHTDEKKQLRIQVSEAKNKTNKQIEKLYEINSRHDEATEKLQIANGKLDGISKKCQRLEEQLYVAKEKLSVSKFQTKYDEKVKEVQHA